MLKRMWKKKVYNVNRRARPEDLAICLINCPRLFKVVGTVEVNTLGTCNSVSDYGGTVLVGQGRTDLGMSFRSS